MRVYTLDSSHKVERCLDVLAWAAWLRKERTGVALTTFANAGVTVSTVFLALDMDAEPEVHPRLFETRVYGGLLDGYQARVATWTQAEHVHAEACEMVRKLIEPDACG